MITWNWEPTLSDSTVVSKNSILFIYRTSSTIVKSFSTHCNQLQYGQYHCLRLNIDCYSFSIAISLLNIVKAAAVFCCFFADIYGTAANNGMQSWARATTLISYRTIERFATIQFWYDPRSKHFDFLRQIISYHLHEQCVFSVGCWWNNARERMSRIHYTDETYAQLNSSYWMIHFCDLVGLN